MKKSLLFCLMTLALSSAQAGTLRPAGPQDQSPARLMTLPAPKGAFERQPVSFAWALDPTADVAAQAPFQAESREYWMMAEAGQLKSGLAIDTTAPGAVIRISPVDADAPLRPGQLRLLRAGKALPVAGAFEQQAGAQALQDAGMDVPDGSVIVKIAKAQGEGRFQLQLPQASGRYLVHVFEPDSPFVLRAQAHRTGVLAGDVLEVSAVLQRGHAKLAGGHMEGELVSPGGQRYPLVFRDGQAKLAVPVDADTTPGLWEVEMFAGSSAGGVSIQREARTAIEVTRPTARFGGGYGFEGSALRFDLPVQVASPGRYEVRGTLYATGRDGVSRPVAQAHSAAWFEAGDRQLGLAFGAQNVAAGYGPPYELRFLELKDQTRMGTLETRELAVRESSAPVRPPVAAPKPRPGVRAVPVRGGVAER